LSLRGGKGSRGPVGAIVAFQGVHGSIGEPKIKGEIRIEGGGGPGWARGQQRREDWEKVSDEVWRS